MEKEESILTVAIWKYDNDNYVYEKSYANTPVALEPGSACPALASMILSPVKDTVLLLVRLCIRMRPFIVWKRGEEVMLKSN